MSRKKIALFFDRTYVDAQPCFTELAVGLAECDYEVHLYMPFSSNNYLPFFSDDRISVMQFPESKFAKAEFWYKIRFASDRRYNAAFGTPLIGAWLGYKTAKQQNIPLYYFADELIEHLIHKSPTKKRKLLEKRNYIANRYADASIALGEERYSAQKKINKIDFDHKYFIIPNAQAGEARKIRSNFFRDLFNIDDRKPILLFAGTLQWNLAKRLFEETKTYGERDYHLVFHARTTGLMSDDYNHPFIKISNNPFPGPMMNYVFSSADIGLALYDKNIHQENINGFTGGKIGAYLKNELPIIAGNVESLKFFEEEKVGIYWNGESGFDELAKMAIENMVQNRSHIPSFYRKYLQYDFFFETFKKHLINTIG